MSKIVDLKAYIQNMMNKAIATQNQEAVDEIAGLTNIVSEVENESNEANEKYGKLLGDYGKLVSHFPASKEAPQDIQQQTAAPTFEEFLADFVKTNK